MTKKSRRKYARVFIAVSAWVLIWVVIAAINSKESKNVAENSTVLEVKEMNYTVENSGFKLIATSSAVVTSGAIEPKEKKDSDQITGQVSENETESSEQKPKKKKEQQKKKVTKKNIKVNKKVKPKQLTKESYNYTHKELITMGKVIYVEARGESHKGMVAVGAVAMNRLRTKSKEFGAENGKIMEVLLKKWAFADISELSDEEFENSDYYEDCIKAAKEAFNGEDPTKKFFKEGALFFYDVTVELSEKQTAYREGIEEYLIGNHAFHIDLND